MDWVVHYNGALASSASRQLVRHIPMARDVSRRVTAFLRRHQPTLAITYEVCDTEYVYPGAEGDVRFGQGSGVAPIVVDARAADTLEPTKILVAGFSEWPAIARHLGGAVNVLATEKGTLVHIMDASVSKATAAAWVLEIIGAEPSDVIAFGDDTNDLALFQWVRGAGGLAIAMGNAVPDLKAAAVWVTADHDAHGVAEALELLRPWETLGSPT